jgi:uncharacterized protein
MSDSLESKLAHLKELVREMQCVAVAYSGGVDSALLLRVAHECLGERVAALTAVSPSLPQHELREAQAIAAQIGAGHVLVESHEVEDPRYLANSPSRCYFCKINVYDQLLDYARANGYLALVDGTNLDDTADHRPGRQAALERGVRSPLQEAGLTKAEVRQLARRYGLPNWDKPAAACLSSRLPYGTPITIALLVQVEQAEAALRRLGFGQLRVRHHDQVARIEVDPADFQAILAAREQIVAALRQLGYTHITLDLAGFRSGSLNEGVVNRIRREA